ncbi:hypothetical protein DRE_01784 [Drechslerella stenobrocha 248]|uniref:Xylanolytic transcriptional activator regulatory domain-containing protein n=1 Tax=Drechslerella stenobrocha 248 TaxID=1043628 RepID=W7I926_9PEZI|nr:hypothetical protein DRE_01784 [Drechslerella stenobrocha 248]
MTGAQTQSRRTNLVQERKYKTVHAKDGGIPLTSEGKRKPQSKTTQPQAPPTKKTRIALEPATLEHLENNDDLEQAAALITELHHAANAILVRQEESMMEEKLAMVAHPEIPVFDRAPYPSLAHVPWESPATPSDCEPIMRSASQTSYSNWDSENHHESLPSSHLSPSRTSSASKTSNSQAPAARSLSPYPYTVGPYPESVHSTSSASACSPLAPPQVSSDEERTQIIANIRDIDIEGTVSNSFKLPSKSALNRYLSAYFNLFHHHFPFLHPATFRPSRASSPLLLAVLSIGALYTFEREQGCMLHVASKILATNCLSRDQRFSSRNCPLWNTQTTLLNMVFASWSGDASGLEWACSVKGLLVNMVSGGRYELQHKRDQRGSEMPSVEDWIEEEGAKRTFFSVYTFFGLLTMTFNHTPVICNNELESLSLPCSESLWNLDYSDEHAWREQFLTSPTPSFKEAHNSLFKGEIPRYSAFGARIMINALFLEVWQVKRTSDGLSNLVAEYKDKLHMALETWQKSVDYCTSETMIVSLNAPQRGPPLLFNAMAMYRATCARLEVDFMSIQEALRYHIPEEVASTMKPARNLVPRSPAMTKVIQLCFECFQIPALMGIRLFAKSSALNWSPEHILFGFDLMLILTLWLNRLEEERETCPPTREEAAMLEKIRDLFDEDSVECGSRLSVAVSRIWGGMLAEVVVWGITRVIGEAFDLLSQTLYDDDETGSMTSTSTTSTTPEVCSPAADYDDMEVAVEH